MSEDTRTDDSPTPLRDRATDIISELYQQAGPMDAVCSGWPCDEVRWLAYRVAELESERDDLKSTQCSCAKSDPDIDNGTENN